MSQNITIKAKGDTLEIFDFSTNDLLATIVDKNTVVFHREAKIEKGTLMHLFNVIVDFKGSLEIYKAGYELF